MTATTIEPMNPAPGRRTAKSTASTTVPIRTRATALTGALYPKEVGRKPRGWAGAAPLAATRPRPPPPGLDGRRADPACLGRPDGVEGQGRIPSRLETRPSPLPAATPPGADIVSKSLSALDSQPTDSRPRTLAEVLAARLGQTGRKQQRSVSDSATRRARRGRLGLRPRPALISLQYRACQRTAARLNFSGSWSSRSRQSSSASLGRGGECDGRVS